MTSTDAPANDWLARRRNYRRIAFGALAAGVVGGLSLRLFDYPLVGEAVYLLGAVGFLAVWVGTDVSLFDERDAALERRASQLALFVLAPVLVLGASAVRVLPRVTDVTVPPIVQGVLYGWIAAFAVFGVCLGWLYLR